ncbi:MAG TPA: DUF6088 family protein [Bacteroidales bacterium]|nr:DUF6088 family protein [Bacteroidales bacterium]HPS72209.1 DUF6088 family protein [Bacteroidales bacterium]
MKITDYISFTIDRFPKGYIFTYSDFTTEVKHKEAVIKALNRMVLSGKIEKIAKGKYYKPEMTSFGKLKPNQGEIIKDLLEENNKPIGYLTGYSLFNTLGFTTQMSHIIQIGRNNIRPDIKRGFYIIKFIKQENIITKKNIPLLQLLDVIRFIKKIPDSSIESSIQRLIFLIQKLSDLETNTLIRLALKYPPSTKALLGAILDHLNKTKDLDKLYNTLNPMTTYRLTNVQNVISTSKKWNFV